jgi:hypothetical protein
MYKTSINHYILKPSSNNAVFRKRFDVWISDITDGAGSCVIIAYKKGESKIIDLVKAPEKLRKQVRMGLKTWENESMSRYLWLQRQLQHFEYDYLVIQMINNEK